MTLLLKDPDALVDYLVDWGAEYLGDDLIVDSTWAVDPDEPGGVAVVSSNFDANSASANAGGGMPGRIYRLVNSITTAMGRTDTRSIVLRVEKR